MAQALMAAIRTVDPGALRTLYTDIFAAWRPSVAAIIRIERTRDGGSFSTRRVLVTQRGETIFSMDASFQLQQDGLSHQLSMPDLSPPQPEKIPPALMDGAFVTWRHEFRRLQSATPQPPEQFVWFKVTADVPVDPALHTSYWYMSRIRPARYSASASQRALSSRPHAGCQLGPCHVVSPSLRHQSVVAVCH